VQDAAGALDAESILDHLAREDVDQSTVRGVVHDPGAQASHGALTGEPTAVLEIRVVDRIGRPVPWAEIRIDDGVEVLLEISADQAGRARVDDPDPLENLRVWGGDRTSLGRGVAKAPRLGSQEVTVVVEPAGTARVRALDGAQQPIEGVVIALGRPESGATLASLGRLPEEGLPPGWRSTTPGQHRCVTDVVGVAEFVGLELGVEYHVLASGPGWITPSSVARLVAEPLGLTRTLDLELGGVVGVAVRFVDPATHEDVRVLERYRQFGLRAVAADGAEHAPLPQEWVDDNLRPWLPDLGELELAGYHPTFFRVVRSTAERELQVQLRFDSPAGSVLGDWIVARWPTDASDLESFDLFVVPPAVEAGFFELRLELGGLSAAEFAEIRSPIGPALVRVRREGSTVQELLLDWSEGPNYRLGPLAYGLYDLQVRDPSGGWIDPLPSLAEFRQVNVGPELSSVVVVPSVGTVRFDCRDIDGVRYGGRVHLQVIVPPIGWDSSSTHFRPQSPMVSNPSFASGAEACLPGIRPGRYVALAGFDTQFAEGFDPPQFEVRAGETVDVPLRLARPERAAKWSTNTDASTPSDR
jgi:hypothetical protein